MFQALRRRMTPSMLISTLALVFAMSGGAYAASKYLITSTKQIKPSVLTQLKGKNGKTGAAGANGANGAQGPQGPQGPAGANGKDGANGTNGKDGVSVASSTEPKGANCAEGGSKFTAANGTTYACNGSPWTAGGTLPKGHTETGAWSLAAGPKGDVVVQISFTLPLAKALGAAEVNYVTETGNGSTCPGTAAKPAAEPGYLCVYQTGVQGVELASGSQAAANIIDASALVPKLGAATSGAVVLFSKHEEQEPFGYGTWAVTEAEE